MRWAALVFITGAWFTAEGMPLPEIKLGASRQAVEVYMTHWYSGFVSTSSVFLECTVMEVSSEVNTSPRQTWLSESCIVRVERAFGRMEQLEGISTAVLKAGYEHSRHDTVDPGWGRLRHLQKGQRILVLLHEYEEAPSFGFEALIELTPGLEALPLVLRRTGFDPLRFTDADLKLVEAASQIFHDQLRAEAEIRQEIRQADTAALNRLVFGIVGGFLALLLTLQFAQTRASKNCG